VWKAFGSSCATVEVGNAANLFDRTRSLWAPSHRLSGRRWPPGIYKNRSIDEANRRRLDWQRQPREGK
jgi:hypothetical protein